MRSGLVFRAAPFVLGALLIAGIVHVAIILLIPMVAGSNASVRLASGAQANGIELFQPENVGNDLLPVPFADPAMVTAICRFDLSDGPVQLRIPTSEAFLSVAILSNTGRVMLALTDKAATRRVLDMVFLTAAQQRQLEAQDPDDEPVQELRIRPGITRGIAVVRSLVLRSAERESVTASFSRMLCKQE